jgi:hypothetical protein
VKKRKSVGAPGRPLSRSSLAAIREIKSKLGAAASLRLRSRGAIDILLIPVVGIIVANVRYWALRSKIPNIARSIVKFTERDRMNKAPRALVTRARQGLILCWGKISVKFLASH